MKPLGSAVSSGAEPPGVIRVLATAALVRSIGAGLLFTLSVLYLTRIVGLQAGAVGVALSVASATGIAGSYAGGLLADRARPRSLIIVFLCCEAGGFAAYPWISSLWVLLPLVSAMAAAGAAGNSARGAALARGFDRAHRVHVRALMRTLTNVGMMLGAALAAVALVRDTAATYHALLWLAAITYLGAAAWCSRLPADLGANPESREAGPIATVSSAPLRDRVFVKLSVLAGVLAMQFVVLEVGVPLWVTGHTAAPRVLVSLALGLNTVLVTLLQVRLSRTSHDVPTAARLSGLAGLLLLLGCVVMWSASVGSSARFAVCAVLVATALLTFGEMLSSAALWGLSFELAPQDRAGAYQGFFAMGMAAGTALAPVLLTHAVVVGGAAGWLGLGLVLGAAGLAIQVRFRNVGAPAPAQFA